MRLKDFVYIAFPLLILGAAIIGLLIDYDLLPMLSKPFEPFMMGLLGLPASAGITLIFGIFRREMALEMLIVVAGTPVLTEFMTPLQIFVFSLVSAIYVPCIATIAVLVREIGWKKTVYLSLATIVLALALGAVVYRLFPIFGILN
jgi:ferrous iron transport protein B